MTPPTVTTLMERGARGNFTPGIRATLQAQPAYLSRLAGDLLAAHFPRSLHDDICAAAGLELDEPVPESAGEDRGGRDPGFRNRVILAYEHRCAITGWDLRIGSTDAGLEAAHIKWHTAGGPSIETNGIALNALHHKLFDLGAFTLSPEKVPRILVSREVHGGEAAGEILLRRHGALIRKPQDDAWLPDPSFIQWHRKEVFKGEPRT